jgi:hypothetical protein
MESPQPVMTITHFGAAYALQTAKTKIESHPTFKEQATPDLKAAIQNIIQDLIDDIESSMQQMKARSV